MADTTPIAIVDDERFDAHHEPMGHHPECPERLDAARQGLRLAIPEAERDRLTPREASLEELQAAHSARYVRALQEVLARGAGHIDADTFFSDGSREAAWLAAGGAADLARAITTGSHATGIALLRPPGHHAEPDTAMGFCLLNNVAVAAHAALHAGARRVAIVDWDVHHGNGTQAAFYADPRVLFVSLHQYPFYPGTGAPTEVGRDAGLGTTINVALPGGCGVADYAQAMRRVVLPALSHFDADVVLVSAGFDAHRSDPLGGMRLDAACYGAMATALLAQHPTGVGFVLEGGYDLQALEASVAAVARAARGTDTVELPQDAASEAATRAIETTLRYVTPHVPGLRVDGA